MSSECGENVVEKKVASRDSLGEMSRRKKSQVVTRDIIGALLIPHRHKFRDS
jgi:hypothetical protein